MLRNCILFIILVGMSRASHAIIPITSSSSRLKVDNSLWGFRTQKEMDDLIKHNYNNPRASYYIINNAYQKGFATHASLIYIRNARGKGYFEPKMWVGAAYAAMIGGGNFAYSLNTPNKAEFTEVMSYRGFLNSQLDEAVKQAPNSPEVLVMSAACIYESIAGSTNSKGYRWDNPQWKKVFSWLRQAQKIAPRWADAQYWYGVALHQYWDETNRRNPFLLSRATTALLLAQRLDPNMVGSCAWVLWLVARDRKRPTEQL